MKKIVTIDPGKFATKAISGNKTGGKRVSFRTKVFEFSDGVDLDAQGKSYKVEFKGKTYIVGDQGEEVDYSVNKANINHKLAVYIAIVALTEEDDNDINVVLGCPTSIYKNEEMRKEYKNYLTNDNKPIEITVNGKFKRFKINNALVLPEGSGVVFLDSSCFKNKRVAVVDLGGLNMNFSVYNNMVPEISSMFTSNLGSYDLENSVLNELKVKYGSSFSSSDIQQFIKQGGVKVKGVIDIASKRIINAKLEQHMAKILQEAKRNNFNLDLMDVVFVGGTSEFMKGKILEHLPHAMVPDKSQWTNVLGFHKLGVLKYEQKQQ